MDFREWSKRLRSTADLDGAFNELENDDSFEAEAAKGRILLLQVRMAACLQRLEKASRILLAGAETTPEEALLHYGTCREASIVAGNSGPLTNPTPRFAAKDPTLLRLLQYHRGVDAAQLLAAGDSTMAEIVFRGLLDESEDHYSLAFWHLGIAACTANLGKDKEALEQLEIGGLHAAAVEHLLGRARLAPRIATLYRSLGGRKAAIEWEQMFFRLPIPERTRRDLERRSSLVLQRFRRSGSFTLV